MRQLFSWCRTIKLFRRVPNDQSECCSFDLLGYRHLSMVVFVLNRQPVRGSQVEERQNDANDYRGCRWSFGMDSN